MERQTESERTRQFSPDVSIPELLTATGLAFVFVFATRLPVLRTGPFDFDEVGFLETIQHHLLPMQHTLFLASARQVGDLLSNRYSGFLYVDMITSAMALVGVWWWLRAIVPAGTAAAAAFLLGVGPLFWSYGAMAGNYTAIPLVGSILLGIAIRGIAWPKSWHPFAAAVVLAIGAGYRQDIGLLWMPIFLFIMWQHRWIRALQAVCVFVIVNLAWLIPMLNDVGGWDAYRRESGEFAHKAGYMNSYWHLGFYDATLRYAVKELLAVVWTFGPALLFVPRGLARLIRRPGGGMTAALLVASMLPAIGMHLMVHFGVAGYSMHDIPALIALVAIGIGADQVMRESPRTAKHRRDPRPLLDRAEPRLLLISILLAFVFLFYPTNYDRTGWWGDFDLAFARHTRIGLRTPTPLRDPKHWRTINSQELPGGKRASARRESIFDLLK